MPRTGIATLPLHHGKAPRWLFSRMSALAGEISEAVVSEFGREGFLGRLSDPYWFQALGCALGFDWHSSGLTTTVTGALKEGLRGRERELGVFIAGGKGAVSRKTPEQIITLGERHMVDPGPLVYASRMSAKVDNSAVQDGYRLYHHVLVFSRGGEWAVVQQGMNPADRTARRYHWLSGKVQSFVVEPHSAVCSDRRGLRALNMTAGASAEVRELSTRIAGQHPDKVLREINLPLRHGVNLSDIRPERLRSVLIKTYERQPRDFEALLGIRGVGPKTVRALSLLSELLYGRAPSYEDPARYSFAHGGKDGTPYPVDRPTYDRTIEVLRGAISSARVGRTERINALKRLNRYFREDR
ncbi:MAG: DUF763 domain-containing protein [Nitrospirota bacterium]|jgi:hypothetical protein